jgi:DNA-3-methyladenine glycosylase II
MTDTSEGTIDLAVDLSGPIDLAASLRPFGRWGDDGIDRWDGTVLVRAMRLEDAGDDDGTVVPYAARIGGDPDRPRLLLRLPSSARQRLAKVERAVGDSFVLPPPELAELAAADDRVGRLVRLYPGIVPVMVPDPFTALIRSISAQQVNLRWATTVRRRIAERYGQRHEVGGTYVYSLRASQVAGASIEDLRQIQLTTAKSRSVIASAQAADGGELRRAVLEAMDDEALIAHLTRLPGIGRWSAEWFLTRTLGRPRVVAGDLGVRKAIGRLYGLGALTSEEQVRRATAHWGASATIVQGLALYDLAVAAGNA